jgi:chromate transporter
LIVIAAALVGYGVARVSPQQLGLKKSDTVESPPRTGRWRDAAQVVALWLVIWWLPVVLTALMLGAGHILVELGLFFSKLAVVSFGGAYALLAYMAQQVVEARGWLAPGEMVDALGLAETTPGPLILVTQFVSFIAAFRTPAPFSPVVAGVLGAAMATWTVFAPSFLWIFAGAPFLEDLRRNQPLAGALAAITAAVVGVILNLAVWFALHVVFTRVAEISAGPLRWFAPDLASLDIGALALAIIAAVLVFVRHMSLIATIGIMAVLGIALRLATG